MNDAFAASEKRHLAEDRDWNYCDVLGCTKEAEPESILCARHEDDDFDYRSGP